MIYHREPSVEDTDAYSSFSDLAPTVHQAVETLRGHVEEFDSIVVTGTSGMAVGFPVALALDKPIGVLRKSNERSHGTAGEIIGLHTLGKRVLFLDDFVSMGETRTKVIKAVETRRQWNTEKSDFEVVVSDMRVVGTYTYREQEYRSH